MVGTALQSLLQQAGHEVRPLSRQKHEGDSVLWSPAAGTIDQTALEGFDAVVHLAGENIAAGRWTPAQKTRIRDSRVDGTRLLSQALAKLQHKPRVLVSASAIGYYGDRGDEILDENSPPGKGFLADVCREWEAATVPAEQAAIRVVHLRFGVILSPTGGALAQMLTPFRLGLGGRLGSGRQYMSWITLDDAIGVIAHALIAEQLQGAVNAVTPEPVTNLAFTKALGQVLGRPTIFPVPAVAARLLLGEMADALLLSSARVLPRKLEASGYEFRYAALEHALRHLLGKTIDSSPYAA
jgi:uncharacterized protein (TIGR01777 family)